MQSDATTQQLFDLLAKRAAESDVLKLFGDQCFFVFAANVEAEDALCSLGCGALREVDDVNGEFVGRLEFFQCLGQRVLGVSEFERYGAIGAEDGDRFVASDAL